MKEFFVRHTSDIAVSDEVLKRLWDADRVAVHFPLQGPEDTESLDPNDYEGPEKGAIRCFIELARDGGYVWAESSVASEAKVGMVAPGTPIVFSNTVWSFNPSFHDASKGVRVAKLKTLQMTRTKTIHPREMMSLRQRHPRQGTIARWGKAKGCVEALVEGRPLPRIWEALSTDAQEILCVEFMREGDLSDIPRLEHLLMPPGRTMKDVDVYGLASDGREVFAQVTNYSREHQESVKKQEALRRYDPSHNVLLFFCDCPERDSDQGLTFIPVHQVWNWAEKRAQLVDKMLAI